MKSPTARAPFPLLGAYAMAPADPDQAADFYRALASEQIGGLEIPVPDAPLDSAAVELISSRLQPGWRVMLTAIPGVMGRLGAEPAYGLASTDGDSRAHALADVARAVDLAHRLADVHGESRVAAIEVHSAPGPMRGGGDALARSLEAIAGWDLAGSQILLEHCDALVTGQAAAKGFLTLEEEIAAIRAAGSPDSLGIAINWGRSAIEMRDSRAPVGHVSAASRAGLLRAVVLSGASDQDSPWGGAWGDAHIPPSGADAALAASSASLLDDDAMAETLADAGPEALLAVKVSVRPTDASVAQRVAVARAVLNQVESHRVS
ncbi:DUF4862 family protein [Demequina aurantiaca]|uniref:DUF4862 family protein n=1 Tax=Demequina aurantiaca TaxID=676200 RepID=UPI003D34E0C6